ncbi:ABC-type phosphate transport system [Commensalibacter communis]|uniref:Phosphate transport system permease protein n=1 Tax=Commensalibacter communis TaxID=2972786 RepID=A0A9W4X7C8_9PROT|nr:phosphate ABC transporter permease subunit PstC [Commensalibacter communis]CAI3954141.1 ABC-type phosphate transport system [Commensalibacter communis]CAI3956036.1 ABC-type phosphate transport system [Commensalibacter communis]CAI3956424.1 ABC-type phosphate transport system [Commensalibacter communis]CAI3957240.1 ABC-type phosphate transport system [Commensalibacter communis]
MLLKQAGYRKDKKIIPYLFTSLMWCGGALIFLIFLGLIFELFWQGKQAFSVFGFHFITSTDWNPGEQQFSAGAALVGTLVSSCIGVVLALPLSFGCAYCLNELMPQRFSKYITASIQLLAAIPSIILGMWGFFILVPLMSQYVQPFLKNIFGNVPYIELLFSGGTYGIGILTAGLILAIMITPFITAIMQESFANTPVMLKESAYSLGATRWEVMHQVIVPWVQKGVVGGVVLGWGRALGETMAVTFVIGNAHHASWSLFMPSNTIASLIALEFSESAAGSLKMSSLMALGAVLMVISFVVLFCSQLLLKQVLKSR